MAVVLPSHEGPNHRLPVRRRGWVVFTVKRNPAATPPPAPSTGTSAVSYADWSSDHTGNPISLSIRLTRSPRYPENIPAPVGTYERYGARAVGSSTKPWWTPTWRTSWTGSRTADVTADFVLQLEATGRHSNVARKAHSTKSLTPGRKGLYAFFKKKFGLTLARLVIAQPIQRVYHDTSGRGAISTRIGRYPA